LKRRARQGDPTAKVLYRAAAYDDRLRLFLWMVIVVFFAASFILLARVAPPIFGFIIEVLVITLGFAWLPSTRSSSKSTELTVQLTPAVVWLLGKKQPVLDWILTAARHYRLTTVHTGLYEREDLLALLDTQKQQPDSRFAPEEIDLLTHVLEFGEKMVGSCMTPRRDVRLIAADEQVSPVVTRELHETTHTRFPVYNDSEDNIVGTLYLRDLVSLKQTSGAIRDIMEPSVYYVHEEYPLEQALHAFLTTKHHLFIVVNSFEEFVGILTIEDILEQILGCKIVDEFDQYENKQAVSANHARIAHKQETQEVVVDKDAAGETEKTSDTETEVVQ
jgi:CBS domain containing-hemolysin-like protein